MAATVPLPKKRPNAINLTSRYRVKTLTPASSEKSNRIFGVKSNRQCHSWRSGCGCFCYCCRRPAVVSWRGLHRLIFRASPDCGLPDANRRRGQANSAHNKPPGASAQSHLPSAIRPRFTRTGSHPALIIILFGQWDVQSGSVTSLFT